MTEPAARAASRLLHVAQTAVRRAWDSCVARGRLVARPRRAGLAARRTLTADLACIAAVCALVWGGIGLLLHEQRANALHDAVQDTENLARAFAENTARTVESMDHLLLFLRSAYRSDPDRFDIAAWSRDAQGFDDLTRRVGILDRTGRLHATNPAVARPRIDASDRGYFRAQRDSTGDALLISEPLIGRESGRWVVQFSRKIIGTDGSFDGVAWVSMDPFSLARFYASLDIGRGSVLLVGLDGIVRAGAPASAGMLGRDIGASPLLAAARQATRGTLDFVGESGEASIVSYRRLDRYGLVVAVGLDRREVLQGYVRSRAEYLAGGVVLTILILLVGRSVIRRRQALVRTQERLLRSQQVLQDTLENMDQGIFMVDAERKLAVINHRAAELFGLPPNVAAVGASFDELLRWQLDHGEFVNDERIRRLAESGGIELTNSDYQRTRPDGTVLEVRTRLLGKSGGGARCAVRTVTDVTERKRAETRISYLAHHDELTGLANRAFFHDRLAHAISLNRRSGTGFAVLCLDLDRFKLVNDRGGHAVGDRLLRMVADRLRENVRGSDTVARLGGDEFAILQVDAGQPGAAAALAQRLIACVSQPYDIEGTQFTVGTSVGVALHPADGGTAELLLKCADTALYKAKEARGAFRFFEPAMDQHLQERYALERDLREAITQDRLDVHFQPICCAESRRPLAYEALARWTDPVRGPVSPAVFIPLAEEAGLIPALGRAVLRIACREATRWPRETRLNVNFSPLQFLEPDLAGQVLRILQDTGLQPDRLALEVTEGVLIRNGDEAFAVMHALQRQGVRVYLDDFGTGYAGLCYLLRFPFDCIKIDRSFVACLATDQAALAIVQATMLLSESLRLEVVAEGVETEAQLELLRVLGCRQVQGFLLGLPRPARDIAASLVRGKDREGLESVL